MHRSAILVVGEKGAGFPRPPKVDFYFHSRTEPTDRIQSARVN